MRICGCTVGQTHRKTLDGRLCAAAYVHDSQAFTARVLADVIVVALGGLLQDCNTASNPEGISGREWCYVEVRAQSDVLSAPSNSPRLMQEQIAKTASQKWVLGLEHRPWQST